MSTNKFIIKIDPAELVPKTSARLFYYGTFILVLVQIVIIAILWKYTPRVIPLFFTEPWGEARLAPKVMLLTIPSLSFISIIINLLVNRANKEISPLLTYTLAVGSATIVVMFTIAMAGILQSII